MAERIPIVLSLSGGVAELSDLSDEAVLRVVFGERGWDANVIIPLEQIQSGSTDELCLTGISGPFVLLSRKSFSTAVEHLNRLQVQGLVRSVLESVEPVSLGNVTRSIYFFQLSDGSEFEKALQKIREIQSSIHTKVFALHVPAVSRSGRKEDENQRVTPKPVPVQNTIPQMNESQQRSNHDARLNELLDALDASDI
jgi:hypothetical protein